MKRIIFTLSILLAGLTLSAQTIRTYNLYNKYRGEKGVISIYVPGCVARLAAGIGDLKPEEAQLLRCIRSVRVLTIDDNERFPGVNFVKEARIHPGDAGFESLVEVHEDGEDVMIMGKIKGDKLKDLLVIVGGEDNVLVHIRGRLNADMIGSLSNIAGLQDMDFTSQL